MQRYDARVDQDMIPYHEETADGDWVKYDAARAEIERLRLELDAEKRSFQRRAAELWQPIYDKARAENERLNNALTEAVNQISDLSARLGQAEGRLAASELVGVVEGWKARAEKAEAERDSQEADFAKSIAIEVAARLKAEAERDEARAQVAAAFEAAAIRSENYARGAPYNQRASINALANSIRGMAPADDRAALEAYGRKKMWEGMHLAATIAGQKSAVMTHYPDITRGYAQGRSGARDAILAEMEKLK